MAIATVLSQIASVFFMVLLGYIANRAGWLPAESGKYLSKIVINIAAPCAVIQSITRQVMDSETVAVMLTIFGVGTATYILSWLISAAFCEVFKVAREDRGIFQNCIIFTNNGFMGLPVANAMFGQEGVFYLVLLNVVMLLPLYTLGVALLRRNRGLHGDRKEPFWLKLRAMLNIPIVSALAGLAIFVLQIPIPENVNAVIDSLASMMFPLAMMTIGIQLTASKPREVMLNHRLNAMVVFRLAVIPLVTFLLLLPFGLDRLMAGIIVLNVTFPCAAMPVALAEEYGQNVKLAAEGTFLSTLFSMISLPIAGVLLTLYVV